MMGNQGVAGRSPDGSGSRRVEKVLLVREFLLSEYRSAAAEADGLPVEREAMPAWDALHELLSILDNQTKATRSDEALLREALDIAREALGRIASNGFGFPIRMIDHKRDKELLAAMDYARDAGKRIAALNPPGVESDGNV